MDPTTPDELASELARLRLWVDAAQDLGRLSLWERDARDGSGRWDRHIFSLYGLEPTPGAPPYETALQLLHPDDRDRVRTSFQASLARPGRHDTRFRIPRADGTMVLVHSIWQVPAQGHRVVGVLIDDTESLALAQDHDAVRAQLGLMSQLVGVSFWRSDLRTGRVHRIGNSWHGPWPDPGPEGLPLAATQAYIHPDDLPAVERATQQAIDGAEAPMIEFRLRERDGSYRPFLTRRVLQRDAQGRPAAVVGVALDVADQVHARQRLGELLESQEMIVDAAGVGVWRWEPASGRREWSDTLRRIYGVAPGDPLPAAGGESLTSVVLPEDRAAVAEALRRVQDPDAPRVETAYRIRRPDGERRHLVGRARRLPGTPVTVIGIVIDVTDLQQAEKALREKAAAERAARAQSAFLSRVSHELRTPLNAVLGFTGLLLDASAEPLSDTQRQHLAHVRDAGHHLLGLVDELLQLGHDAPLDGADPAQSSDVSGLIEQTVDWLADRANAAGVQVCVSGHCPRLRGGEPAWRQVVRHLLTNAIQYNRPAGHVQVALRLTDDPGWAELEVRDSGVGMSAQQQRHLFEPFNRLGAESLGVAGTGLGLATVRRIVDALGGTVTVDSAPGRGTSVTLRVLRADDELAAPAMVAADAPGAPAMLAADAPGAPVGAEAQEVPEAREARDPGDPRDPGDAVAAPDPAGTATVPPARTAPAAATVDVLYVEDNKVNALLVGEVLARRPRLRLHLAATVAEATDLARRLRPALLLVDMHLPDGTGHDLLARLPVGEGRPPGACVALSADVMPSEIERALAAGFDDYWSKPIDVERFLADVDRLLAPSA